MKALQNENLKELTEKVYDLISVTSVELGHRTDGKTMAALAKIFAQDLMTENRFKRLTFNQIKDGFKIGVRFCEFEPFLNIKTFYRWTISHKKTISDAEYKVRTLNQDPKKVPYYQEPIKLLK
tara:strand:+ start:2088 stop:2456 length:369 start_codon:yes stop_codon:yes gene_type:complete